MHLELALVVARKEDGCSVVPLGRSAPVAAGFAGPFRSRAGSLPEGSLVALDVRPGTPEVVWRWFPARVLTVTDDVLSLDEPVHGVISARVHDRLPRRPLIGQTVYVSAGLAHDWRIDAAEDDPAAAAAALPEIEALYARMTEGRGADGEP